MAAIAERPKVTELTWAGLPLPVTIRPAVPMTDDDLMIFSRQNRTYRIERKANGELEIMSPAGGRGSRWESRIIRELDLWAEQNGGASFSSAAGFHLPDGSVLSPDAAWVSDARWNSLTEAEQTAYPPLCPDFVVEVLSPSDSRPALRAKMELWIANGVQLAWMVDPFAATVTVYRPGRAPEQLGRPDSVEAEEPVAGFRLATASLWEI